MSKYLHFQLCKGDIVCACSGGSWGKSAIFDSDDRQIILNTSTLRLRFYGDLGCNDYLYHLTKSSFFKLQLAEQLSGMQPNFGYAHYSKILIPLPPFQEQIRITDIINGLLPVLSKYSSAQDKLDKLNDTIRPNLKKSILQEAIQGRLVPQIAEEGTAENLLEEIRKEKQKLLKEGKLKKKDVIDSVIFKGDDNKYFEKIGNEVRCIDDEIPYDIPSTWMWCRFGDIVKTITGKTPERGIQKYWSNGIYNWVSIADMLPNGIVNTTKERISQVAANECFRNISKKGSLIMSFKLTVGRTSILGIDAYHNEAIITILPFVDKDYTFRDYLLNILPIIAITGNSKDAIKGKTLNSKSIASLLIPLPPLDEQQRIIKRVQELFGLLK